MKPIKNLFTIYMNKLEGRYHHLLTCIKILCHQQMTQILLADSEYDPWWSIQDLYTTQTYLNKNMKHTLLKKFTKWKLHLNAHKTETILFSQCHPCLPSSIQIYDTFVPRPQTYSIQAFFQSLNYPTPSIYISSPAKPQAFFVTSYSYPFKTSHSQSTPNYPYINCSSDTFLLRPHLSGVQHVTQTTLNSKSSKISAYK